MAPNDDQEPNLDLVDTRAPFPATDQSTYFNTAAVGLASRASAESARTAVANLIGADRADMALIASVSAAAGLVASQFGPADAGQNVVIGEREYSSNSFPWRCVPRRANRDRPPIRHCRHR